ncbi:hypothetical protein ABLE68_20105 [Nocardioides sp. CN2-186]|uniref:hypothetical protein n=1 Tax=Nocardioides tweenelious TaxID=3156607 RepID=UPI0032B5AE94
MPRLTRLLILPCAAVLATVLVGCSSDDSSDASADPSTSTSASASASASPSATGSPLPGSAQVCAAGAAVKESIGEVNSALQAGNFGDAVTSLGKVRTSLGQLTTASKELTSQARDALDPRTQEITTQIKLLADAQTLDQLQSAFTIIPLEFQQLEGDIKTNAGC